MKADFGLFRWRRINFFVFLYLIDVDNLDIVVGNLLILDLLIVVVDVRDLVVIIDVWYLVVIVDVWYLVVIIDVWDLVVVIIRILICGDLRFVVARRNDELDFPPGLLSAVGQGGDVGAQLLDDLQHLLFVGVRLRIGDLFPQSDQI